HICDPLVLRSLPTRRSSDLLITVAYGTNDWGKFASIAEFRMQCEGYIATLTACYPKADVAVLTPLWRKDWGTPREMGTFPELIRDRKSTRLNSSHVKISYAV